MALDQLPARVALPQPASSWDRAEEVRFRQAVDEALSGVLRYAADLAQDVIQPLEDGTTAAALLTAIKTVDGTGSGLDADLLDGKDSTAFAILTSTQTFTAINTFSSTTDFDDNILIEKTSTPKVTIKTTTQDAGGRPILIFENNSIGQITGDDHAHQKFDFMSEPTDSRTYSAEVRIFGAGTDYSTDLLSLLHNGTDGEISTNSGKLRLIPVSTSYVEIYTDSDLPLVLKQGTTGNPWNRIEFHISDGTRRGWVGMDTGGGLNIVNNQSNVDIILQTTGTGITKISGSAYNGNHLVMGSYHLWVDATGDLRIKSSAPTSATDGTVVGTQT